MHPDAPLLFDRVPHLLPMYEAFEAALLARLPGVSIRVQKTQISFDPQAQKIKTPIRCPSAPI